MTNDQMLATTYLGMALRSPLVASASPLMRDISNIRQFEDAGAGAVVLDSLYEEQIRKERDALLHHLEYGTESFPEALSYFPEPDKFHAATDEYLLRIQQARAAVDIPVIASLNGATIGGWTEFAWLMEEAGASALELNVYNIPTDILEPGTQVEDQLVTIIDAVKSRVNIPVAVKLSPYYSNLANVVNQVQGAGADGVVLFNRFYQPDIDLETLETVPNILLSTSYDLRLPLRWIGILYGRIGLDMAASSGIHNAKDAIKLLLVGATVTMMTSAALKHGIDHFKVVENELVQWLTEQEYDSVEQLRGSLSQQHSEDPSAFERAQYMRGLTTYLLANQ